MRYIILRGQRVPTVEHAVCIFIYLFIYLSSTSDLQPSTPTANQLPGQLVSTEIRTMYKYKF